MMRCLACDNILKDSEIIYYEDRKAHEELCRSCRDIISKNFGEGFLTDEEIIQQYIIEVNANEETKKE